jgi:hypothetical protein
MTIKYTISDIHTNGFVNFALPKFVRHDGTMFDNETVGRAIARKNEWKLADIRFIDDNHSYLWFTYQGKDIAFCQIIFP